MATSRASKQDGQPPIGADWTAFAESLYFVLVPGLNPERDQLISFRDKVFAVVRDPTFLEGLAKAIDALSPEDVEPADRRLLLEALSEELRAVTRMAIGVKESRPSTGVKKWFKNKVQPLASRGSVATGSVTDLADKWGKGNTYGLLVHSGLTLFKEFLDLAKGQ